MTVEKIKTTSWWDVLKKIFLFLIVLQMLPVFFTSFKGGFQQVLNPKPKVANIQIRGPLTDSRRIVKQIKKVADQTDIKAIFVHIDSPGGSPATSQLIFSELMRAKAKKPVVALVENVCASGSYYVAIAADYIIAPASSLVGSIGVLWPILNVKKLADDWKITTQISKAGKFKTVGNPMGEVMTPEECAYHQGIIDDTYESFIRDVARARGLSSDKRTEWADGKIFTGSQALKLGLIDQIGDMTDAEAELKKRGKFEGEIEFVKAPKPSAFARLFTADADDEVSTEVTSMVSTALTQALCNFAAQDNQQLR